MQDNNNEMSCELLHLDQEHVEGLKTSIPPDVALFQIADFFKMFGDSTRIKILYLLGEAELCVHDLATVLGMSQSAVSHQLKTLKANRLVKYRKSGRSAFYSLDDEHIKSILTQGHEHIKE